MNHEQELPSYFIWRRLHSLSGLWLVGFLALHFLINSQAALPIGEDGSGFIRGANDIRKLPYLYALEIIFLAIPFAVHMIWGTLYLRTSAPNSYPTDGSKPALTAYPRNHAYTWQRITSWILLFLVTLHVIQMRFVESPTEFRLSQGTFYVTKIADDPGAQSVSHRLGVRLLDQRAIQNEVHQINRDPASGTNQTEQWHNLLTTPLEPGQLLALSPDYGTALLMMVRETFKRIDMVLLYTVLVLSASFHALNGLWTFMISWGITISEKAQKRMRGLSTVLMALFAFWGLAAVWGTYWINLRQ